MCFGQCCCQKVFVFKVLTSNEQLELLVKKFPSHVTEGNVDSVVVGSSNAAPGLNSLAHIKTHLVLGRQEFVSAGEAFLMKVGVLPEPPMSSPSRTFPGVSSL